MTQQPPTSQLARTPRAVDLVQNLDDGSYCLRVQQQGHIFWRRLDGMPGECIPAPGAWSTDRAFLATYWTYLGTLRLARGAYHLTQPATLAG
jgi:hypothetical protein